MTVQPYFYRVAVYYFMKQLVVLFFNGNPEGVIEIASELHCGVAVIDDFASSYMSAKMVYKTVDLEDLLVEGLLVCGVVKAVDDHIPICSIKAYSGLLTFGR